MSEEHGPDFAEDVDIALVEAIGEPGQRRFRLIVGLNDRTTIMWMEKQQLEALGQAIGRILDQVDVSGVASEAVAEGGMFDLDTRHQFRVGRIEIGYNHDRQRVLIVAYDIESDEDESPSLAALFPLSLAKVLSERAADVVAAGRPRCVLCGMPMGPGPHACAEQNGHLIHYT
ncbi:MAG: DUF3090 family protein [Thermomicrobiales bacterium]|nr:DUF3090 family protein [Thermomicrobiales bacterium]